MIIGGDSLIPANRGRVWQALNDPEILRQCIPGCEKLERTSDTSFDTQVRAAIGPISATFNAVVTLTDIDSERGYTIVGEGKGGAAGFARGQARVDLEDEPGGTRLRYKADVNVGGKLAQVGSRLIQGTAKKLSEQFFGGFAAILGEGAESTTQKSLADAAAADAAVPLSRPDRPRTDKKQAQTAWRGIGVVTIVVVLALIAIWFLI